MIKNISNFIIIIVVVALSISIIFSLATITTIETTYANHTKYHLNNSLVDVTISSDDDIPDWLLEDIKRNIAMKAEQKKVSENNNNLQLQTKTIENTTKAKIILTSHKYRENDGGGDFDDLVGQVKNIGNGTAKDVSIIFTYYDVNGNAIGSDTAEIYADILQPGQKSPFLQFRDVKETPNMAYYEIALSWYDSDGIQQYIENVEITKDPQEKIPIIENTKQNNENENFPFFSTDGNDVEQLKDEENEDEDDEDDEDDDEDDEDDEDDKDKDEDND